VGRSPADPVPSGDVTDVTSKMRRRARRHRDHWHRPPGVVAL